MKFKIPIDYDAVSGDGDNLPPYYNGVNPVNGPVMGYEAEVDIQADVSAGGMSDVLMVKEYITKDLNSVVMNFSSSSSFNVHSMHMAGGPSFAVPGGNPTTTITMRIALDPMIQNMNQFQKLLEDFLNKHNMFLTRIKLSAMDRDILYGEGDFSSKPTFTYRPTQIQCCECHEDFVHTELKKEDGVWGEGAYEKPIESDTVCPKCGAWDCCELEFEKLPC